MSFLETLIPDFLKKKELETLDPGGPVDFYKPDREETEMRLREFQKTLEPLEKPSLLDKILSGFAGEISIEGKGMGTDPEVQKQLDAIPNEDIPETQPATINDAYAEEPTGESKFVWKTDDKQPFPKEWDSYVINAAASQGHDPKLLASLVANESGHNWQGGEGDSGQSFGITQVQYPTYQDTAEYFGDKVMTEEEFKQAVQDPTTAIGIASKVLRYKTDVFADGDTFLGVARYNGAGPKSIEYAKAAYNRIGYPIPDGY